ncbi:clathrin associated protein complex large subunit [Ceratobasidium sp. 428]|nr:clathrin associated protein complex large subunit [Ceratobasidium sp. 428]
MPINILGTFLSNWDNDIRFVASYPKYSQWTPTPYKRPLNIILDCLRDGDISIRRRALELSYAPVNETNFHVLIRELLASLEVADNEFKLGMKVQISLAAERFAPNKRWHIDPVLRALKLAHNYVRDEVLSSFIRFIALKEDISEESLTLATVWLLGPGEFAEVLIQGGLVDGETLKPASPEFHSRA